MPSTHVYIYLEKAPVPAGLLETIGEGREATAQTSGAASQIPLKRTNPSGTRHSTFLSAECSENCTRLRRAA